MPFLNTISAKEHAGLRLVLALAANYNQAPLSLQAIAKQESLSLKYLEQLIIPLRRSGLVKSSRGRQGGYALVKNPKQISLKNVLQILNDEPVLVSCLDKNSPCTLSKHCRSKLAWQKVEQAVGESLEKIKLAQLLK